MDRRNSGSGPCADKRVMRGTCGPGAGAATAWRAAAGHLAAREIESNGLARACAWAVPALSSRLLGLIVLGLACGILGFAGCGLEAPQKPAFETTLNVPLAVQSYTGEDLAQSLEAVYADSAQPSPLTLRIRESLEPLEVDQRLRVELGSQTREIAIDDLRFEAPEIPPVSYAVPTLLPPGPWSSGGSEGLVIEAFTFAPEPTLLGPFTSYDQIELLGGEIELTITNALPIALGGDAGLQVTILDLTESPPREVARWQTGALLAAGATMTGRCNLDSGALGNELALSVTGGSPGSEGEPVTLHGEDALTIAAAFGDLSLRSITGDVPAMSFSALIDVPLPGEIRIDSADIASGVIAWDLRNDLPVDIEILVASPSLLEEQQPLERILALPAGGSLLYELDLAGLSLAGDEAGVGGMGAGHRGTGEEPAGEDPAAQGRCQWEFTVCIPETSCSSPLELGHVVRAASNAGELCFDRVRGVFDAYEVAPDPVMVAVDYPEATEDIEFVAAELSLLLRNRLAVGAEADLWIEGVGGSISGGDSSAPGRVPLPITIAPGAADQPAESRVVVNELDSELLALLATRPDSLRLGGTLRLGDGQTVAEVRAGDYVDGSIEVVAPLRLRLGVAQHQGDPFEVDLEDDVRRRIDERLENLIVDAQVENHFPTGVRIRLHFARTEGALFVNDDLLLEGDMVQAGTVDPATGRVTAVAESCVRLSLCQGDIRLFATEQLYGAMEVELTGEGDSPVEIWSTDYVTIRGVVAFDCRWE